MTQPKPFTPEELEKYTQIFNHLDQDKDGKITHADLKKAFTDAGWGLSDQEIQAIINKADTGKTGFVTWEEFLKVAETRPVKRRIEAALREMFNKLDTDKSGFITAANLRVLVTEVGAGDDISDAELNEIIKRADKTGDGKISFEEFLQHFMQM